ncbi:MAG: hypothetical protein HN348_33435, partial [Proteobacteria bacterium]|nr:hypothetical protein [Pseudomonadota bacterium]
SGPMHLAGAAGVPVVALFGPTNPDDGFFVYRGCIVRHQCECQPCSLHGQTQCPKGHHRCMNIEPVRVIEAVEACCAGQ